MTRNKKLVSGILLLVVLILGVVGYVYWEEQKSPITPTPVPRDLGKTILLTDTADSGLGTLRQALIDAETGDTIIFDPRVFPPSNPATIWLNNSLPGINQGNLTIDASNAGVILDGSKITEGFVSGLEVVSNGNIVRGLQVSNFSGAGIVLSGGAQHNIIGGDRGTGNGPFGQGNLVVGNNIGIGLWGGGTSFNTLTGNLVGTDASGLALRGNHGTGIYVSGGASHNMIGPDNIIAYNREEGIQIYNPNSVGNTITQNSIHGNGIFGIYLNDGGNAGLSAPFFFDFDLNAGTVTAGACANCTVEIFSDSGEEGAVFEGQVIADNVGSFTFNKGASFTGPHLTATATDAEGNTSIFSVPTTGTRRLVQLQEGNREPKTRLITKPSRELADNRMGDFMPLKNFDESMASWYINQTTSFGYRLVFLSIDWLDFTQVLENGEYSEFKIRPEQDKVITDLANNDINIIYCLVYYEPVQVGVPFNWTNLDAYLVKDPNNEGRFRTEEEIGRFLDYTRFIVHHFKDRIKYYQILNEPLNGIRGQYVRSEDYINLVKRVIPVIRDESPDAKIVVGSVHGLPNEPGCYDYLLDILNSDVMPMVDGISFHPSPDLSPEYDPACYSGLPCKDIGEGYYKYYQNTIQEIKDIATSAGFKGEYITEGPTFAEQPRPPQTHYYRDIIHTKYSSRSIIMHLYNNFTVILPLGDWNIIPSTKRVVQNLCNIMAGAKAAKPASRNTEPCDEHKELQFFFAKR
jgi:hypothetical protein